MRRRRPRGEAIQPLPRLAPGLSREEWLAAMRDQWADAHEEGSDYWAEAHAALAEIEAFELDAAATTARIAGLVRGWEAAS